LTESLPSTLLWGENVNKNLLGIGIALVIVGVIFVAATVYQEQVAAPPEVPHMEIPSAKYEWRSRNPGITWLGIGFITLSAVLILVGVKKK